MQLAYLALFAVIAVMLVARAARRERTDYRVFKQLTTTRERQQTFARWLRDSFLIYGGLSIAVLVAAWTLIPRAAASARSWPPVAWLTNELSGGFGIGLAIGAAVALVVVLILPVLLLRAKVGDIPTLGDISALLPRTRGELKYGVGLSINAGVVEELLFRLGMRALVFGITGNGALSFLIASLLFGLLHLYQRVIGIVGTTILGLIFSLLYLLTNSIAVVIVVHALVDLRSLVLIPLIVGRVWHVAEAPLEPVMPAGLPETPTEEAHH